MKITPKFFDSRKELEEYKNKNHYISVIETDLTGDEILATFALSQDPWEYRSNVISAVTRVHCATLSGCLASGILGLGEEEDD